MVGWVFVFSITVLALFRANCRIVVRCLSCAQAAYNVTIGITVICVCMNDIWIWRITNITLLRAKRKVVMCNLSFFRANIAIRIASNGVFDRIVFVI